MTFFWWDNFDAKKENFSGSIHTTHGIGFQELGNSVTSRPEIPTERSNRKTVIPSKNNLPGQIINPHKNPPDFTRTQKSVFKIDDKIANKILTWKAMRLNSATAQKIPSFPGWI